MNEIMNHRQNMGHRVNLGTTKIGISNYQLVSARKHLIYTTSIYYKKIPV
ncbi:MAG: hypothetical protein BWZ06_00866 [Bacteroidetes bacterium ADurb.BinA261]|jgi:hypothetical protein|nr:MAG: hypothetical protein BWZ06_00866 [Bacteroidetes bacterium ADurb.BinA261]